MLILVAGVGVLDGRALGREAVGAGLEGFAVSSCVGFELRTRKEDVRGGGRR